MHKPLEIGETFKSKSCNTFSILEVISTSKVRVRFNDEFMHECLVTASSIRLGSIKNPFYGKVFGVGYLGIGKYKSRLGPASKGYLNTPEYNAWVNMLSRCYYDKYTSRNIGNKVYDGASVCKEWHNFQIFSEWYLNAVDHIRAVSPDIPVALDKDLLSTNIKLYSPLTCCVLPVCINNEIKDHTKRLVNGKLSTLRLKKDGSYSLFLSSEGNTIEINRLTKMECVLEYISAKESIVHRMGERYKNIVQDNVYTALINFKLKGKDKLLSGLDLKISGKP